MTPERWDRLEATVGELVVGQAELRRDVAELKTDVAVLKTDVAELKTDVAVLKTDVAALKTDVAALKTDVRQLGHSQDDLKRYMLVLHEEVLDRIKALAPDFEPLRREMRQGFADLRQEFNDRLVPLEAYVREQQGQR